MAVYWEDLFTKIWMMDVMVLDDERQRGWDTPMTGFDMRCTSSDHGIQQVKIKDRVRGVLVTNQE